MSLPNKQFSRTEKYLNFLSTGSGTLSDLPKPQSRVDEYLYYLCKNGGTGGGAFIKVGEVPDKNSLPTSYSGNKGDYYLDLSNGNWWVWNGNSFYEKVPDNKIHIHKQNTLSNTWTIQHNLNNKYPLIICVDENDNEIEGEVLNRTINYLEIKFCEPLKGIATLK